MLLHLENTRIRTFRGKIISRASDVSGQYQSSVNLPRGSTNEDIDLRDLLDVQVEASEQLKVETGGMMMSPIQSRCSNQGVHVIFKDEESDLWDPSVSSSETKRVPSPDTYFCIG